MCLLILAHRAHPLFRLAVAANRDELHSRPTAPARFWPEASHVLAGRDLLAGGTWMGVTRSGRFAALTNYRDMAARREGARSRGLLVAGYLLGNEPAAEYISRVAAEAEAYDGFNLLVADGDGLFWVSNRDGAPRELPPGVYGLSNHLLDTPWPKVARTREAFERLVAEGGDLRPTELLELLSDRRQAEDARLPDTGLGLELERLLSAPFIVSPSYGTRTSTALILGAGGRARLMERTFAPDATPLGTVDEEFVIGEAPACAMLRT